MVTSIYQTCYQHGNCWLSSIICQIGNCTQNIQKRVEFQTSG